MRSSQPSPLSSYIRFSKKPSWSLSYVGGVDQAVGVVVVADEVDPAVPVEVHVDVDPTVGAPVQRVMVPVAVAVDVDPGVVALGRRHVGHAGAGSHGWCLRKGPARSRRPCRRAHHRPWPGRDPPSPKPPSPPRSRRRSPRRAPLRQGLPCLRPSPRRSSAEPGAGRAASSAASGRPEPFGRGSGLAEPGAGRCSRPVPTACPMPVPTAWPMPPPVEWPKPTASVSPPPSPASGVSRPKTLDWLARVSTAVCPPVSPLTWLRSSAARRR